MKSKIDSCKLLTSDELKQVQGEPVKEALRSDREQGGLIVSQCYYSLPTAANSVVLNVTTATEGAGARDVCPRINLFDFLSDLQRDHVQQGVASAENRFALRNRWRTVYKPLT